MDIKIIKALYFQFLAIYGDRFNRSHTNDLIIELWWSEWQKGLSDIDPLSIESAIQYCRKNLEWPPSIAEFRKFCVLKNPIPDFETVYQAAIRRDFSHPLIKLSFDKISTKLLREGLDSEVRKEFKKAYEDACVEFERISDGMNSIEKKPVLKLLAS